MSNVAYVEKLPLCDLCGNTAHFNARTVTGPWAYLCDLCFGEYGVGLGVGMGQMLEVGKDITEISPEYDWYERGVVASDAADSAIERAMG